VWVQSGGVLTCGRYLAIGANGPANNPGTGVATFTGGKANINSGYRILLPDAANATGVLNIGTEAGGAAVINHPSGTGVVMNNNSGGNSTLNLNSGTIQLGARVYKNNGTGTVTRNYNGGILQALTNITFLDNINTINDVVYNGGLILDCQTFTNTCTANLTAATGNGIYPAGGSFMISSGGGWGYIGAPLVTVSGGSGTGAMAIANISGGVVTGVTMTCPGKNYQVGDNLSFAFAGGGATNAASTFVHTLIATDLIPNSTGGLVKQGSGMLTLSGTNSYVGGTLVSAGSLFVTTDSGLGQGNVTVADGSILTLTNGATQNYIKSTANLVVGTSAAVNLNFNGTDTINGLSLDGGATYVAAGTYGSPSSTAANQDSHFTGSGVLNVTAQLASPTLSLTSSVNPAEVTQAVTFIATAGGSSGTPTGSVAFKDGTTILSIATLNGSGVAAFTTSVLGIGTHNITVIYNGNAVYASANASALSQVINPRDDIWTGSVNNIWDINSTGNWLDLGGQAVYHDVDLVQFDDTATGNVDVLLGVNVSPSGVMVTNLNKNYSLSGTGSINGTGGLTKLGAGTLTISNANAYTGVTAVQNGTLNFNGVAAYTGGGALNVGNGFGNAVVNLNGSGTFTFSTASSMAVGGLANDTADTGSGAIFQSGGTLSLGSGYLELGAGGSSAYGAYNLSGGSLNTVNTSGIRVGAYGLGAFRQTGGILNSSKYLAIGAVTGSGSWAGTGVVTFTGGSAAISSSYRIIVGDGANGTGVFNLGTLGGGNAVVTALYNSGGRGGFELLDSAGALAGTANFNCGTLTLAGSIYQNSTLGVVAVLNFNGGSLQASNNINLIDASITSGTVFNGGLVVDSQNYMVTNPASLYPASGNGIYPAGGSIVVTDNGGSGYIGEPLVTVSGGSGSGAMAVANISGGVVTSVTLTCPGQNYQAGDAISFDFAGGGAATPASTFNYTLQSGDVVANNGGLTKRGNGQLFLTGNNSYIGQTRVEGGTLVVNTENGNASGDYVLTNGGTLDVAVANAGSQLYVASLTFIGATGGTLTLDLSQAGSIAAAPVNASSSLNINGAGVINVLVAGLTVGQYPLIQYSGSLTGSGSLVLGSLPTGVQANLVTNTTASPNTIDLVVTSSGQPRWNGQVSGVSNSTWDISTTANWVDVFTTQIEGYKEGEPVLFDDNASGTTTVNLVINVHPTSVTFSNSTLAYALIGANKISGTTGLTTEGNGMVTIQNALNDYTGVTVVGGGTLNVTNLANGGSPSAIGAATANPGNLVFTNGGNLVYSGPAVAIDRGYTVGNGGGTLTVNADVALGGVTVTTNSSTFTKAGLATLTYNGTGVNQLGATNNLKAGTVVLDGSRGSQSNSVSGLMVVGSDSASTGSLLVTNSTLGTGALIVDNGAASVRAGATVVNSGTLSVGRTAGVNATLTVTDNAVINSMNTVYVGGASGNGVLNLQSSGVLTLAPAGQFCIGGTGNTNDNSAGVINQTAGTMNFAPASDLYLEIGAGGGGAYGAYNLSSGTAIEPTGFGIRVGAGGLGVFNQTGGTLACGRYFAIGTISGSLSSGGQGVATFAGGITTIDGGYRFIIGDKPSSQSVLNMGTEAGGSASVTSLNGTGITVLSDNNAIKATINLNHGTLQLGGPIYKNTGNTAGADFLNLNGGILQAGTNNITLAAASLEAVNVYNGGITVDTQTNSATIAANLHVTVGNGVYPSGGVIAITSGGGSGYIGAPLVSVTTSGVGSNATANANITGGGMSGVTITCPGQGYAAGDHLYFNFSGGGTTNPAAMFDYTLQAGDLTANGRGGLMKIGQGILTLSGANTYTGDTMIGTGTLLLSGSLLGNGTVWVTNNGTLSGNGIINGPVNVGSNAVLAVGNTSIGALTISNSLTFAAGATNNVRLNKLTGTNDTVQGLTQVNYEGTLMVTNLGGTLALNDKFKLFGADSYVGNFSTLVLPTLSAGLGWSNSLAVDGSIQVVSGVNTNSPMLTNSFSGGVLTLSWPTDHSGWELQAQTNALNVGLNTNWVTIPGSDMVTSTNFVINPQNPTVFYRLVYHQ
jgi:autotransporter-associated beta strand protein